MSCPEHHAVDNDFSASANRSEPPLDLTITYALPATPRVRLRDAVRFALYGVVLTQASGAPVEVAEYGERAHAGSILFGLETEPGWKALEHFLRRLNDAARRGLVTFHGRRTYDLFSIDESSFGGGEEAIPAAYFDQDRDFDDDTDRVFLAAHYGTPSEILAAENAGLLDHDTLVARGICEWESVRVERDGFLAWLHYEFPQTKHGAGARRVASDEEIVAVIVRHRDADGRLSIRRAEALMKDEGLDVPQSVLRRLLAETGSKSPPGRPRKKASDRA